MDKSKHLGLRIEPEVHYKLHYVAKYEGRSANGQIQHLLRKCIADYEKEHGAIKVPFSATSAEDEFFK